MAMLKWLRAWNERVVLKVSCVLCNQENKKQVNKQKQLKTVSEKLKILPMIFIPVVN